MWSGVTLLVSLSVTTALFALLYRVLPDVHLRWRDVTTGAFVTAELFTIGQQFIGLYLSQSSVASSYGATGSLMILLLWVYYSCQVLLLGGRVHSRVRAAPRYSPTRNHSLKRTLTTKWRNFVYLGVGGVSLTLPARKWSGSRRFCSSR